MKSAEPDERQRMLATVTALAPTRHGTGVLGRVKVPRAARAAASTSAATLTPPLRARRRATIGASRNYEREHHRMPVVLLADRGIERPGVHVEGTTGSPVWQLADIIAGDTSPSKRMAACPCLVPATRHIVPTEGYRAVQLDELQRVRQPWAVPEHLEGLAANRMRRH